MLKLKDMLKKIFNSLGLILKIILIFFPYKIKRLILIKCYGYELSTKSYIGISFIYPRKLKMDEGAKIGHFNVAIHLDKIVIGKNSSIGRSNWITGFPIGTKSPFFKHDKERKSELIIGKESAITKKHHIDCTNYIHIGDYVTIAGYDSQLLTHSIDVYKSRQDSHPIEIGDYCFVSTRVIILGGALLPAYSVLAAGSVLNKAYHDEWTLYAGVPARSRKTLPMDAKYFKRIGGIVY